MERLDGWTDGWMEERGREGRRNLYTSVERGKGCASEEKGENVTKVEGGKKGAVEYQEGRGRIPRRAR